MRGPTSEIITIGKRQWLIGMAWHSYEDVPDKGLLAEDAQRLQADWVCVRIGASAIQAGFCQPIPDVKTPRRVYSLAAMLADSREQPWLGVFKIAEDRFWLIAIRDKHAIMPSMFPSQGDYVGSEEEVKRLRDSHAGMAEWTHIAGDLNDLAQWVDEVDERPTPVRNLHGRPLPGATGMVSIALLLSAVAGGVYWWTEKRTMEERQIAEQRAAMSARLQAGEAPVAPTSPLLTSPTPETWLQACRDIIHDLPISYLGWVLAEVGCSAQQVSVVWQRKDGATVDDRPPGQVQDSGDVIEQAIPLPALPPAAADDSIDLAEARIRLRGWSQAAGLQVTFASGTQASATPQLPGADTGPTAISHPESPNTAFTMTSPVSPFGLDFSPSPGLRLTSIRTTDSGWQLQGVLHGRTL